MHRMLFQYHPTIGWIFIPGLKARVEHEGGGYLLRTNSSGFRCRHEFRPERPPGTFRVLLFGDSYTAGDGVSDGQRYGDILEELLPGLEVYNFGVTGTGTDQQYLVFREFARQIDADLVVIAVMVENIRRVAARYRAATSHDGRMGALAKPYFELGDGGQLELHNVPVPAQDIPFERLAAGERGRVDFGGRLAKVRPLLDRIDERWKAPVQRLLRYQPLPAYSRPDHPHWRLLRALLRQWINEAQAPVVICPIPLFHYVERTARADDYRARFAELHRPPRAVVHDPLPDLWRASPRDRRGFRYVRDPHLTPAGHRALAASLAEAIRASGYGRTRLPDARTASREVG